jgi:hypothetical protein
MNEQVTEIFQGNEEAFQKYFAEAVLRARRVVAEVLAEAREKVPETSTVEGDNSLDPLPNIPDNKLTAPITHDE